MDSVQVGIGDTSPEDASSEQSFSPDSSDSSDVCGEALVHPRVGEDHQVEIPPMLTGYEHVQLLRNPYHSNVRRDGSHCFLIGKPVPVMWVSKEAGTCEVESIKLSNTDGRCMDLENVEDWENFKTQKRENSKDDGQGHKYEKRGRFPVPGLPSESWNHFEVDCFVLGLYIFGKNLLQVKEFVETKEMGQILSFYYGKFYRSNAYSRWSACRKMRNKKSILGYKLFSGCRLQELFSRLTPHLPKEQENSLYEMSQSFAEGCTSLEDYISSLKALVGIKALVETVGIGKGNDLTNLVTETSKTNHMFSVRPEIPFGKACSSFSTSDVIKFLTGDFRLSKARSSDLFWEAVWPRLLANGWHSELPKNGSYTSAKGSLVFLVPGIKKFSRRKLVKGDHYFDSVSDVLKKVASKPELLETEAEEPRAGCSSKEENGWAAEVDSDGSKSSDDGCTRFLQPRTMTSVASLMKFMVVDTSIEHGEYHSKIRELRSLPAEIKQSSFLRSRSKIGTTAIGVPGNAVVESDTMDFLASSLENSISSKNFISLSNGIVGSKRKKPVGNHKEPGTLANPNASITTLLSADRETKDITFIRRPKLVLVNPTACITKKRRLAPCRKEVISNFQIITPSELEGARCVLGLPASKNNVRSRSQKNVPSVTSSAASSTPEESTSHKQSFSISRVNSESQKEYYVKREVPELFDLNLPRVPTEPLSFEQLKMEPLSNVNEISEGSDALATGQPQRSGDGLSEQAQQPTVGGRRQSTRSRPLSTKAWEALEVGWMNPRPIKKQRPQTWPQEHNTKLVIRHQIKGNASSNCSGGDDATDSEERLSNEISDDMTTGIPLVRNEGIVTGKFPGSSQASGHPSDEKALE